MTLRNALAYTPQTDPDVTTTLYHNAINIKNIDAAVHLLTNSPNNSPIDIHARTASNQRLRNRWYSKPRDDAERAEATITETRTATLIHIATTRPGPATTNALYTRALANSTASIRILAALTTLTDTQQTHACEHILTNLLNNPDLSHDEAAAAGVFLSNNRQHALTWALQHRDSITKHRRHRRIIEQWHANNIATAAHSGDDTVAADTLGLYSHADADLLAAITYLDHHTWKRLLQRSGDDNIIAAITATAQTAGISPVIATLWTKTHTEPAAPENTWEDFNTALGAATTSNDLVELAAGDTYITLDYTHVGDAFISLWTHPNATETSRQSALSHPRVRNAYTSTNEYVWQALCRITDRDDDNSWLALRQKWPHNITDAILAEHASDTVVEHVVIANYQTQTDQAAAGRNPGFDAIVNGYNAHPRYHTMYRTHLPVPYLNALPEPEAGQLLNLLAPQLADLPHATFTALWTLADTFTGTVPELLDTLTAITGPT